MQISQNEKVAQSPMISVLRKREWQGATCIQSSAVVFRLFPKPVNLPQKTVGYRLTLIQSSNLYFSLMYVILLELNHCCAYTGNVFML